jgi:hypothetical protein
MLVRCPECSVAREVEPHDGESKPGAGDVCERCGYSALASAAGAGSESRDTSSFAGARAKLKNATQDLFRLSGNYSLSGAESLPAEARVLSEPSPALVKAPEGIPALGRPAEASIMFSLEELMKANNHPVSIRHDEASDELWAMQAATPLFGTAHDQALLTTPLKLEQTSSMDPMTVPSRPPTVRRWLSIVLAVGGLGIAVAGVGWYTHTSNQLESRAAAELASAHLSEQKATEQAASEQAASGAEQPALVVPASITAELPAAGGSEPGERAVPAEGSVEPSLAGGADGSGANAPSVVGGSPVPNEETRSLDARAQKSALAKGKLAAKKSSQRPIFPSSTQKAFPFDMGAAKKALNAAAAASAACGQGGVPGKGKVQLTFAPSGRVSNADLVEGAFGGSSAGKCALRNFRAARVPAFSGAPVTVAKSFSVL